MEQQQELIKLQRVHKNGPLFLFLCKYNVTQYGNKYQSLDTIRGNISLVANRVALCNNSTYMVTHSMLRTHEGK